MRMEAAMFCFRSPFGVVQSTVEAQSSDVFHFTGKPGTYYVGLKAVQMCDRVRTFRRLTDEFGQPQTGERARSLQTLIWYTAQETALPKTTVEDYAKLTALEVNFDQIDLSPGNRSNGLTPISTLPGWFCTQHK